MSDPIAIIYDLQRRVASLERMVLSLNHRGSRDRVQRPLSLDTMALLQMHRQYQQPEDREAAAILDYLNKKTRPAATGRAYVTSKGNNS